MRTDTKQLKQGAQALKRIAAALNLRRPVVTLSPATTLGDVLTLTLGDSATSAALAISGDNRETLLAVPLAVNLAELIAALGTVKGSVRLSAPDSETLGLAFDNGDNVTLTRVDNLHSAPEVRGLGGSQPVDLGMFAEVANVASSDTTRPILTALAILECGQTLAATDSYRLRSADLASGNTITGPEGNPAPESLIPAAIVIAAAKYSAAGQLSLGAGVYRITAGHSLTITGRLIDGDFPNFRQLFPQNPERVTLDAVELAAVIKRISAAAKAAGQKSDTVPAVLKFGAESGRVIVTGAGVSGSAAVELGVLAEPLTIGLNPGFFAEIIEHASGSGQWITLGLIGNLKPVTVAGGRTLSLLMPVRIGETVTA